MKQKLIVYIGRFQNVFEPDTCNKNSLEEPKKCKKAQNLAKWKKKIGLYFQKKIYSLH